MAVATSNASANGFFEDDDEDTLRLLIKNDNDGESRSPRLSSLATRFKEDHDLHRQEDSSHWAALADSARSQGFAFHDSLTSEGDSTEPPKSFPAAFESDDGKKHLKATVALLKVSETRAVQLTMSSLRSLNETTNFQALLGTRSLLDKVMEYHFKQRRARLSVIAECLRKEQDPDAADHSTIVEILDSLDSMYVINSSNRGLLRFLISIACQKDEGNTLGREQLLPAKELRIDAPSSLQESLSRSPEERAWHQFIANCTDLNRSRIHQERVEAMEALVVLLYHRIQGGVRRVDLMLILQAFQSANSFFTTYSEGERLSQLAGLICAECMGLWRVFEDDPDNVNWVVTHPLLTDIIPSRDGNSAGSPAQAEKELEALSTVLLKYANHINDQKMIPESLALLSFGLLLILAYNSILASSHGSDEGGYWQVTGNKGHEMVEIAGEKLSAFDYFNAIMEMLVSSPTLEGIRGESSDLPYEWLYFGDNEAINMEICDEQNSNEMDAASLTYASIGHEILNALTLAFQDTILSVHHTAACQNVAMVCELAAVIYRNSPILCEPFWVDWEACTSATPPSKIPPICSVMDSAFLLVSNALRVEQSEQSTLSKEQLLATLAPLMRLVSSVCYTADNVEAAFGVLPPFLLQKALLVCASDGQNDDFHFCQLKWSILDSLAKITRVGNSVACRSLIRDALCEGGRVSGPGVLLNVLAKSDDHSRNMTLNISAELLKEAPVPFALAFAQGLQSLAVFKALDEKPVGLPVSLLFNGLVNSMIRIVFSSECGDVDAENYLNLVWEGVLKLSSVLHLSLSNVAREPIPLNTVQVIFSFFASLLENSRSIIMLHKSIAIQSKARGIRDALVEMLALHSSFGESVMFYAVLPISSSIGASIEQYVQEKKIIRFASMDEKTERSKYGLWHSAATRTLESPTEECSNQTHVKSLVTSGEVKLESICQLYGCTIKDLLRTVFGALNLLKKWTVHIENMVVGDECLDSDNETLLDRDQKDRLLSLSPFNLLTASAATPHLIRGKDEVLYLWNSAKPSNFQLLTWYIDVETAARWPFSLSSLSLDLVHACAAHTKIGSPKDNVVDTPLYREMLRPKFIELVGKLTENALSSAADDCGDKDDGKIVDALGMLGFRILCIMADVGAPLACEESAVGHLIDSFFKQMETIAESFYQAREANGNECLKDDGLINNLQIALGCICFLRSLWKGAAITSRSAGAGNHIGKYIDDESATFSILSKIVLQHSRKDLPDLGESSEACGDNKGKCVLFAFLAVTIDFLRFATQFCLKTKKEISGDMMKLWDDNSVEIMSMPRHFSSIDGCVDVARATKAFSLPASLLACKMELKNPTALLKLHSVTAVTDLGPVFFNVDVTAVTALLSSLGGDDCSKEDLKSKVFFLAVSNHLLSSQLLLLRNWRQFSGTLLDLCGQRVGSSSGLNVTQSSLSVNVNPFLSCALETLRVMHTNITSVELALTNGTDLFAYDIGTMAETMAELVLHFVVQEDCDRVPGVSADLLVEILGLISLSSVKLFGLLESNATNCCIVEQQLLASSIALLNVLDSGGIAFSGAQASKMHGIVNYLVRTTSQLLKLMEARQIRDDAKQDCLKTCLVLLSVLAAKSLESNPYIGSKGTVRSALLRTFEELNVLTTLVQQGKLYSSIAIGSQQETEKFATATAKAEEESAIDVVESIFSLFLAISLTGDMLHLLSNTGVFEIFTRNPLFSASGRLWDSLNVNTTSSIPLRGYIPTKEQVKPQAPTGRDTAFFAGKHDPVHLLWQKALQCCKTALSSSKRDNSLTLLEKERIQGSVADFILHYRQMIALSLRNILSSSFTKNSLSEASLIMSLLSEFCKRPCGDRSTHHAICVEFLPLSTALVARIGSFLGAAATSREFFNTVADIDEASDSEVDMARLSPFGRVQNARHEAIRYSHYASRFTTAVTKSDFETSSHAGTDDLRSASGLENHGKASMTCKFEKSMEEAAASCMFFATSLIWETHSARACFTVFSDVEASRIDAMALVKPKMAIAFTSDRESERTRYAGGLPSKSIHFAQVMHCNTLDRMFYVRRLEDSGSEIVPARQLIGIEDVSKRQCVFGFAPAADSATELESLADSASVGHLILGLRWCADLSSASKPFIKRFAELLSIVLGTELSIHAEIGTALNRKEEDVDRLGAQLLDLYEDPLDGDDITEAGRLKPILSEICWRSTRQQLKNELEGAKAMRGSVNAKNEMAETGIFFGSVGRSGNRNPFDELKMNYD